jgi:PAS domain S-box-containing protein
MFEFSAKSLKNVETDLRLKLNNGEKIWIHLHASIYKIADDHLIYVGIGYDITRRKLLLKQLEETNKRFTKEHKMLSFDNHKLSYIFNQLNSLVLIWKDYGKMVFVNEQMEKRFKYKKKELLGKSWMDLIIPDKPINEIDNVNLLKKVIKNPDKFVVNYNYNVDKDGNIFYVNWSNLVYYDIDNKKHVLSIGNILEEYISI